MPITSTISIERFDGNGSTVVPYPIAIERDRDDDLFVLIDGVATVGFTVDVDGVRTLSEVPVGTEVIVYRNTPRTQETQFPPNSTPSPEDVRAALDKLTLMVQEISGVALPGRQSIKFPIVEPAGNNTELPIPFERRAMVLGFAADTGELTLYNVADFGVNDDLTGVPKLISDNLYVGRNVFSRQVSNTPVQLVGALVILWNCFKGNLAKVTLTGDHFLANPTNVMPGTYILLVAQDGVGGRTLSFGSNFKTPGGLGVALSTDQNKGDILTFINFGGSDLYLVSQLSFEVSPPDVPEPEWPDGTITYNGDPLLLNGQYLTYTEP